MYSWLLGLPYLVFGLAIMFMGWAAGSYLFSLVCSRKALLTSPWYLHLGGAGVFFLVVRVALGLATLSWLAAIIGLLGAFRFSVVFAILLPVIVAGVPFGYQFAAGNRPMLLRDRLALGAEWLQGRRTEKIFGAIAVFIVCVVSVNALIGALIPDMNHDPMWYHLAVPQQWTFTGSFDVLPNVFPSAYPLAVESLFAVMMLLSPDPVYSSIVTAYGGVLLLTGMIGASFMAIERSPGVVSAGWGIAAIAACWVPMVAINGLLAPVQPKNDVIAALWTFCGIMLIWLPMLCVADSPARRWWFVSGTLLGTACSAKPPIILITGICLGWAVVASWMMDKQRSGWLSRRTVTGALAAVVAMLIAMAPWMIRGWLALGQPLFPLGRSLASTPDEYKPLVDTFYELHHLNGGGIGGFLHQLVNFPARIFNAGVGGERCIYFFIAAAIAGIFAGRGAWRLFAVMMLSQLAMFFVVAGRDIVFRLFAPLHYAIAPLIAWIVGNYFPLLSRPTRFALAAILIVSIALSVGVQQHRLANFNTMQWKFRPVLSDEAVKQFATHSEQGELYLAFSEIRPLIRTDERVLLLGSPYPFYLHRDTIWNDESVDPGIEHRWGTSSVSDAITLLSRLEIDVLVINKNYEKRFATDPTEALIENGTLQGETTLSVPEGWKIFRVTKN